MDKILVIVLFLSLNSETLAWKNWNLKNSLKTTEHCLEENEIAVGFLNYFRNKNPVNLTMDFFEICLNSPDPIRCVGIWNIFGYHITKLIQDDDLQPLVDFEKEQSVLYRNSKHDCLTFLIRLHALRRQI